MLLCSISIGNNVTDFRSLFGLTGNLAIELPSLNMTPKIAGRLA